MDIDIPKKSDVSETKINPRGRRSTSVIMLPKKTPSAAFMKALDAVGAMKPKRK